MDTNTPSRVWLPIPRQNVFLASLAFAAGILFAATAQYRPPLWFLIAALAFATGALFLRSIPKLQTALSFFAIASLGALAFQLQEISPAPASTSLDGAEIQMVAHVTRNSIERPGFFGSPRNVVELETESVTQNGVIQNTSAGIRASLYQRSRAARDEEAEESQSPKLAPLFYGQRIHCIAKLRSPHNYGNPGAFDYRAYLESRGITYLA